jgi:gliding motility-associated protein GldC
VTGLRWQANDAPEPDPQPAEAMILALWDGEHRNAMRIDLWTPCLTVDDMNDFVNQTLLSLADTYRRATNDDDLTPWKRRAAPKCRSVSTSASLVRSASATLAAGVGDTFAAALALGSVNPGDRQLIVGTGAQPKQVRGTPPRGSSGPGLHAFCRLEGWLLQASVNSAGGG